MTRTSFVAAIAAVTLLLASGAEASDIKIIANSGVTASEISLDELKAVFLMTKGSLDGVDVAPVLAKSGPAHDAMLRQYLGKSDAALSTYYRSLVFTGKAAMPKTVATDAEVAEYVSKTKGAIGYISASAPVPGAKTLAVK